MPTGHDLALRTQTRDVLHELSQRDGQLANMYLGAIYALTQTGNPDRFAQAAHSLRELMEKFPASVLGLPVKGASLGDKVRQLADAWGRLPELPSAFEVEGTQIDRPLQKFLGECRKFFEWLAKDRDDARARVAQLHAKFEPTGRELPEPIEQARSKRWISLRSYFNRVSKHSPNLVPREFLHYVEELERMLTDLMRPPTFDELDSIDQIIAEGEGRDP